MGPGAGGGGGGKGAAVQGRYGAVVDCKSQTPPFFSSLFLLCPPTPTPTSPSGFLERS